MLKRLFDLAIAAVALVLLSPLFLVIAILVKLGSKGPVFFAGERVGLNWRLFRIYKFRTMVVDSSQTGAGITAGDDDRITRTGAYLRKYKVDELPQLVNVLKGDMSLVGPRPEDPRYAQLFSDDYDYILKMRPGITDLASIMYSDEGDLLARSDDPEDTYVSKIMPEKIELAREYIGRASLAFDIQLLFRTLLSISGIRKEAR